MSETDLGRGPELIVGARTGERRKRGARSTFYGPPAVFCGT